MVTVSHKYDSAGHYSMNEVHLAPSGKLLLLTGTFVVVVAVAAVAGVEIIKMEEDWLRGFDPYFYGLQSGSESSEYTPNADATLGARLHRPEGRG